MSFYKSISNNVCILCISYSLIYFDYGINWRKLFWSIALYFHHKYLMLLVAYHIIALYFSYNGNNLNKYINRYCWWFTDAYLMPLLRDTWNKISYYEQWVEYFWSYLLIELLNGKNWTWNMKQDVKIWVDYCGIGGGKEGQWSGYLDFWGWGVQK